MQRQQRAETARSSGTEILRAYITGDAEEDEDICTLPAHAARKGLIQYATLEDHERPPSP